MTRTTLLSPDRRLLLIALLTVPLALAACGDKSGGNQTATTGANTPSVVTSGTKPGSTDLGATTEPGSNAPVSYADGETAFRDGKYPEAKQLFESYVETRPENPWGFYMLGLSAWKSGDLAAAESAFTRSLALDSTNVKSYLNSARVLLDLDRNHEALERAEAALRLDSTSSDAFRLIARAYHGLGQVDAAIAAYHQAIVLDESDVWAMNNLGVLYLDQGQPESALPPLARAVQLKATAPVFQNNLGIALERTGHIGAARQAFEAAVHADSSYTKALVSLARVNALMVDSTDIVKVDDLAQEFRLQVGMWRDNLAKSVPDTAVSPSPDSVVAVPQQKPDSQ